jgi:probable phosphoglycerate mutase
MEAPSWPKALWLVRHGQSAGNVAADLAEGAHAASVAVVGRDADVPLSALGERQSQALGRWFARMAPAERPTAILTSPYTRARVTSVLIAKELDEGLHEELDDSIEVAADERLRERELGSFDGLTRRGWTERHPEEAELRERLGKFYHRPPGGESWCDVVLRLRTLVQDLELHHAQARLLIVTHQVVVLCLRYILETMDEATILRIDRDAGVPNCAVTSYVSPDEHDRRGRLHLVLENHVAPVADAGEAITASPDEPVAPR